MIIGYEITDDRGHAFVKRWIEALRSGNYTQARGRLRGHVGNNDIGVGGKKACCCLGVGSDLLTKGEWAYSDNGWSWVDPTYGSYMSMPGPSFFASIWGDYAHHVSTSNELVDFFSSMNDTYRMSFDQIADAAEDLISDRAMSFDAWKVKHVPALQVYYHNV